MCRGGVVCLVKNVAIYRDILTRIKSINLISIELNQELEYMPFSFYRVLNSFAFGILIIFASVCGAYASKIV
jgi:hypothetical protein